MIDSFSQQPIIIKRHRAMALFLICSAFGIACVGTLCFYLFILQYQFRASLTILLTFPSILVPLLLIVWWMRVTWGLWTRQLFVPGSLLQIDEQGIHAGLMPGEPGATFLAWSEIRSISCCKVGPLKLFCVYSRTPLIRPARSGLRYYRFQSLRERTGASLNVQQEWMGQTIQATLAQISSQYAAELQRYHISLQKTHSHEWSQR